VKYLGTRAAKREIDLHPDIAEFQRRYVTGMSDLLFRTKRGTPHRYSNLEDRWRAPRFMAMGLDDEIAKA